MKKFLDCISIVGATPSKFHGTKKYVSTGAVATTEIDESEVVEVTYEDRPSRANLSAEAGDILFAKMQGTRKTLLLDSETEENIYSTGFYAVRANPEVITTECLYYLIDSELFLAQKDKNCSGATQKAITNGGMAKIEISVPALSEQGILVDKLKHLTQLIADKKKQLNLFDEIIKSRFIELFGDPERNPKKWPVVSITEIIRGKVSNGFFAKRDVYRNDGNVQVLGVANIVNRMYSNIEGLPRTNATQAEKEKYRVRYGDMLFCRSSLVAEGIGKASIVPQDTPQNVMFECHVIRLPLDLQKCVPEFVQELSTTPYFRKQIIAQSKTATMTTIGQDGIQKAAIILPPVERQQEFLRFVEQTDKSKYHGEFTCEMEVAA